MKRPSVTRISLALAASGALVLLASAAPGAGVATAGHVAGPGEVVLPAGQGIAGDYEPDLVLPDATIANLDAAGNQHLYAQQAAALPQVAPGLKWQNVGPYGQDDPADYPTGSLRFARNAGMGSVVKVDPSDASGNSVYVGNMGGLWYTNDAGAHWKVLSDSFSRGAVGAIGIDARDPDNLYVGTGIGYLTTSGDAPGSGIWVSHDKGKTWTRPAKNIRGYATNDIAVTPDGILAGTSDGLYRSTDDGASFTRVNLNDNATHTAPATGAYANWISAIAVNPLHPDRIVVAVGLSQGKKPGPDNQPLSPGNGLYLSTHGLTGPFDYMTTSSQLTNPTASTDPIGRIMLSWVKDPATNDATVLWAIVSDAKLAYGGSTSAADLVTTTTGKSVNQTSTQLNGLYRSDDDGANWDVKATPHSLTASINDGLGVYPALGYGIGVQASYNLWVQGDPRDPNQVYFGLEEVFQSIRPTTSGPGLSDYEIIQRYWDVCGSTTYLENLYKGQSCPDQTPYLGGVSTHPDQHAGTLVSTAGGVRMYTGNDGGFFRQDSHVLQTGENAFDNDNWTAMNTLPTVQAWKTARKPDGEFLTALQDNGGGFFAPGGTGTLVSSGDGVNAVATSNPDVWYLSAQGAIVYVTTDHGKTIRAIPADLAGPGFLSPLAIDPTDENHLAVAGRDVHETTKGPNTTTTLDPLLYTVIQTDWAQSFDAGTSPVSKAAYGAQALAIRGPAVYAAMCGLCRNTLGDVALVHATVATNVGKDGCEPKKATTDCWHLAEGNGLPHNSIWNLAIDPTDTKTIYVALNNNSQIGYDPAVGGTQRIMVSHDAGESFTDITGNLPRSQARDIVVRDGRLVVATDNGVFMGPKTGRFWSRLGKGVPPVRVFDLDLDSTGRYLTASVYGRGIWVLDFKAQAPSSSGPGPKGEPQKPKPQGGKGLPATGANAAVAALATLLLATAVVARRVRRAV
ncbi:MAG: hypothetical protein QOE45_2647 [Frankiaceae bacterium]|jgi:photosystem II stability/assembly factor-like uncharacterized protein|nr:hypothetical protein [Frankiaceae bacterium]